MDFDFRLIRYSGLEFSRTKGLVYASSAFASFECFRQQRMVQSAVSSGTLSGQVTDKSGAVIPEVQVSAVNQETQVRYTAITNRDGLYRLPPLPVGSYDLTFSRTQFTTTDVRAVEVSVGRTTTISPTLDIGSVTQQVTVEAAAAMLHPTDTSQASVVDQKLIANLPLNGRRYTDFVLLTPNVTADGQFGLVSIAGQQGGADSGYANGNGSNSSCARPRPHDVLHLVEEYRQQRRGF